jgi:hypothetical protein
MAVSSSLVCVSPRDRKFAGRAYSKRPSLRVSQISYCLVNECDSSDLVTVEENATTFAGYRVSRRHARCLTIVDQLGRA